MALIGFDSGEATRFPTYRTNQNTNWHSVADQPSPWQLLIGQNCGAGVMSSGGIYGTTCLRVQGPGVSGSAIAGMRRHFGAVLSESFISFAWKIDWFQARDIFALTTSTGTIVCRLAIDANGNLLVYAATTLKATITTGWNPNTWHTIEIHIHTATAPPGNTLIVKIDGGPENDCSGTAMSDWYYLVLGHPYTALIGATNQLFDSIQVNSPSGSLNNSWAGSPRIPTALRPTSDDAVSDFIRSGGAADYECIDEVPPNLDTDYISSAVVNDRSLFGFGALAEPAGTAIVGVCLTAVAKRADVAYLTPVVSRGGTEVVVTALKKAVGSDYMQPLEFFMEVDPITSLPWTQANLNASVLGIKHTIT